MEGGERDQVVLVVLVDAKDCMTNLLLDFSDVASACF